MNRLFIDEYEFTIDGVGVIRCLFNLLEADSSKSERTDRILDLIEKEWLTKQNLFEVASMMAQEKICTQK